MADEVEFGPAADVWAREKAAEQDAYYDRLDATADKYFGTDEELGFDSDISRDIVVTYATGELYDPDSGLTWNGKEWEDLSGSYESVKGGKSGGQEMKGGFLDGVGGGNKGINPLDLVNAGAKLAGGIAGAVSGQKGPQNDVPQTPAKSGGQQTSGPGRQQTSGPGPGQKTSSLLTAKNAAIAAGIYWLATRKKG